MNKRAHLDLATLPLALPLQAALAVSLCMAILGLPDLDHARSLGFRALYLATFAAWILPLTWMQRWLWRRRVAWWVQATLLLAATYAMSVLNNAAGQVLAIQLGLAPGMRWAFLLRGLDSCWLALITFCAVHAVVAYYVSLGQAQRQLAEALALARDAELRALRYQLHPHFLFNTLNAVSALVAAQRNREANRMIARLAEFLRATLDRGDCHEHALADELALTESYLDIEKARLGERLAVSIQIGPDVLDALVPYLLLQPLVENAIRHGIAPRIAPGRLALRLWHAHQRLHLCVENDVDPAHEAGARGIGTDNIAARLAQLYPGEHLFEAGPFDGGYRVTIALPLRAAGAA